MPPSEPLRPDGAVGLSYASILVAGLTDPSVQTPDAITGPNGKDAVRRYNVYRNNVTVSLIDALAATFPAVQRATGVAFFRAMARFHIRATPPTSPLLFEYGHDFPDFIAHYEYARPLPWLADVARIERAWLDAYHAADRAPLSGADLAAVPPEQLADIIFVAHPATRLVRSDFPALTHFVTNRGDDAPAPIETTGPEDALITRPGDDVVVRALPPGGSIFLAALIAGETLGAAAAMALDATPSFDLSGNIAGMIAAGVFAEIHLGASS